VSTELVQIDFKFPNLLERYNQHFRRILIGIASDIQTNRGLLFDAEGAYNGHEKWQDLKSKKNLKIAKNGLQTRQILRKTGALKNSIGPTAPTGEPGPDGYVKIEGDKKLAVVKIGTYLKYARIHDQGGEINHPGTDNGFGRGIKIKAHTIKMPKRNFTDWNETDGKNMKLFLKNLTDVLNGK